jgi:hypothetical protein
VKKHIFTFALVAGIYAVSATQVTAAPPVKEDPNASPTHNWDKVLPASQRFTVLDSYNGQAVRDNETGLVWEKSLTGGNGIQWAAASYLCINKNVGGRKAWRLPSIAELLSLIDPNQNNPSLPAGHPFSGLQSIYWSATTIQDLPTFVWGVYITNGLTTTIDKTSGVSAWCVRGPMQESAYGANPGANP